MITEIAKAKVNLTLQILGRRPDGYHELISLVTFADAGDTVAMDAAAETALDVDGPFAARIDGENLIAKACRLIREADAGFGIGHIRLTKTLPVAAGLGGGSADAAALLRILSRAHPELDERIDLQTIARALGADVSVCMKQRAALMWGVGELVEEIAPLPVFFLVMANPGVPLSTADVFRALRAPALARPAATPDFPSTFGSLEALVAYMRGRGNELEATAKSLCPPIAGVLAALSRAPHCLYAAQAGSGPTCFGVFAHELKAQAVAEALSAAQPTWWVRPARAG